MNQKVVIITGASRGLGKILALTYGKNRMKVLINYREKESEARDVAEEIKRTGGEALTFGADVRNHEMVNKMVDFVYKKWGRIDILINNAAITKDQLLIKISPSDWDEVIDTNLKGPFNMIKTVSRFMIHQKKGHIINIASISGLIGRVGQSSYSASKAGLIGLTKSLAKELGRYNIRINAVFPGLLITDMIEGGKPLIRKTAIKESVIQSFSDIKGVAEFIYHLTEMDFISGQIFNLDSRII